MISIDQLLDGVTVSVEPLAVEPGSAPGSVRACGTAGVVHLVGGARLYCSPDNVVVLPARGCGHCDLGPGRGFRTGAGRIRVTYRGAVGLFDTLREPLVQVLTADDPVWPAFEETLGELLTQRPGARAMAEALLRRWVILLFRRWWADGQRAPAWLAVLDDCRLGRVVAAMQDQPEQAFTVPNLAGTAGMSRSVFIERFAAATGHSPMEFLKTVRLDRAAYLLTSTDLPIKGIARRVGYISRSSFTRAFIAAHGLAPLAFRSAARAQDGGAPLPDAGRRRPPNTATMVVIPSRQEAS